MSKVRDEMIEFFDERYLADAEEHIILELSKPHEETQVGDPITGDEPWEIEILAIIKRAIPDCTALTLYQACKHMNEYALKDIIEQDREEQRQCRP